MSDGEPLALVLPTLTARPKQGDKNPNKQTQVHPWIDQKSKERLDDATVGEEAPGSGVIRVGSDGLSPNGKITCDGQPATGSVHSHRAPPGGNVSDRAATHRINSQREPAQRYRADG